MKKDQEIRYYTDELHQEFSGITRNTITIDDTYRYIHHNPLWKLGAFIVYRILITPVAWLYMRFVFHMKTVNRKALKECRKTGYFLYGNHTQAPGDGFMPTLLTWPKDDYVVVNADNVSLKGTRTVMEMIGAFPLPNNIKGMKHFMKAMKERAAQGKGIVIYPEAHIWPYYTGIRPFTEEAFGYPVMFHKPVYAFTVTYQKRRASSHANITVYVDGPFYPDEKLKGKEAQKKLRDQVFQAMQERSRNSTYEVIRYVKQEENMDK